MSFHSLHNNKNRLLNYSEENVYEQIINSDSISPSNVFSKVRIADVINISKSGINDNLYSYALTAHFDFVITDQNLMPEFVIEFNGPSHNDSAQKSRDKKKIELCKLFDLPLLVINDRYIKRCYRGELSLLSWILDVFYLRQAFYDAQDKGIVPWDEDFDPLSVYSNGLDSKSGKRWPYQIGLDSRLKLQSLYKQKKILEPTSSGMMGRDNDNHLRGCCMVRIDESLCVYIESGMRNYNFPMSLSFLFEEILMISLYDAVSNFFRTGVGSIPLGEAKNHILSLRKRVSPISIHSCGELTSYLAPFW